MEVIGVFSSWVMALSKLSCCSLRRTSRTRKMVFKMMPAMMKPKKMTPRMRGTISRKLRMIQLVLSTVAATAIHTPRVTNSAIFDVRLTGRMIGWGQDSTVSPRQTLIRDGLRLAATAFLFERGDGLIVHIPGLEDAKDNAAGEAGSGQGAEDAGCLLLVFRLRDALALQKLAGQLFFVDFVIGRPNGAVDDVPVHAFGLQVLGDAQASELFILFAKAGVTFGVRSVVQIFVLLQPGHHYFHEQFAVRLIADAAAHQALNFGDRAHLPAERTHSVFVERLFVVGASRALERHRPIIGGRHAVSGMKRIHEGTDLVIADPWLLPPAAIAPEPACRTPTLVCNSVRLSDSCAGHRENPAAWQSRRRTKIAQDPVIVVPAGGSRSHTSAGCRGC